MSIQVEKLQGLLHRVQENRTRPRSVEGAAPAASRPRPVSAPQAAPTPTPVVPASPAAIEAPVAARGNRGSSPLEMAVTGELDRAQPIPKPGAVRAPEPPAPAPAPPAPAPVAAAPTPARGPDGGVELANPAAPQISRPVAQIVSKNPAATSMSFGELLRRSLSLRPR